MIRDRLTCTKDANPGDGAALTSTGPMVERMHKPYPNALQYLNGKVPLGPMKSAGTPDFRTNPRLRLSYPEPLASNQSTGLHEEIANLNPRVEIRLP